MISNLRDRPVSAVPDPTAGGEAARRLELTVLRREAVAQDVVMLELGAADGSPLPEWQPGAHVSVALGAGAEAIVRQYSLCGDPADRTRWRIAVLRVPDGRGGSRRIHEQVREGDRLLVHVPRNHFPFAPAERCLFVAGGIGITPLLPMVRAAAQAGCDWRLVYVARTHERLAFADELRAIDAERVVLHCNDADGRLDLDALTADLGTDTVLYACGPEGLLEALEERAAGGGWTLHLERFAPAAPAAGSDADTAFEVVIASTGERLAVAPGQSILDALDAAGIEVERSCCEGTCGTCETGVLSGEPDHRDTVLTQQEREQGDFMMVCVSRSRSPELVLDL